MEQKSPSVYILTNKTQGILYIGVTSNLVNRIWQHRQKLVTGFSKRYNTDRLVWHESHSKMYDALTREKQLKKWNRAWKIELIESLNPAWKDLYDDIVG